MSGVYGCGRFGRLPPCAPPQPACPSRAVGAGAAFGLRIPAAPRCPIFPSSNPWNRRVDRLPTAAASDAIVRSIGIGGGLHADFGSGLYQGGPIGIPITVVPGSQRKVPVSFDYAGESDRGPYPVPRGVRIEAGSDRPAIVVDRDHCRLYERSALRRTAGGWHGVSGPISNV